MAQPAPPTDLPEADQQQEAVKKTPEPAPQTVQTEEQEAALRTGDLPAEKLKVPNSWRKPGAPSVSSGTDSEGLRKAA